MNRHLALLLTVMMLCSCAGPVAATPTGPVIVAGDAVVSVDGNGTLVVVGSYWGGSRAAINWASLDIDNTNPQQSLIFKDGTGNGNFAVLNRVVSGAPTNISGSIRTVDASGNPAQIGQVFIVNPSGININNGASINCGAITLSCLDTSPTDFVNSPNKPIVFSTGTPLGTSGSIIFSLGSDTRALNYIAVLGANSIDVAGVAGGLNSKLLADPDTGTLLLAQANSITLNVAEPAKIGYSGVTSCNFSGKAYFSSDTGQYDALMQAGKIINIVDNQNPGAKTYIGISGGVTADSALLCKTFELYQGNTNSALAIYAVSNNNTPLTGFRYIGANTSNIDMSSGTVSATSYGYGKVSDAAITINQAYLTDLQASYAATKGFFGLAAASDSGYQALVAKLGDITQAATVADKISGGNWAFEAQSAAAKIIIMNKSNYFSGLAVNGAAGGAGFFNADTAATGLTVHTSALTGSYSAPDHAGLYLTSLGDITQDGPIYAPYLYAVSSKNNGTVTLTNAANDISHEFDVYLRNSGSHALSYTNVAGGGLNVKRITADSGAVTVTANQNINLDSSGGLAPASLSVIANDRTSGGMIVQNAITVNSAILTTNDLTLQAPNITTQGTLTSQNGRVMLWNNNEYSNIQVNAQITSNANSGFNRAAIVLNGGNGPVSVGNLTLLRCNRFDSSLSATPYIAIFGDGSQAIPDEWFNMTFADITSFSGQINSSAPTDYGITYRNLWGHL